MSYHSYDVRGSAPGCEGGSCQLFGIFGWFLQVIIAAWCVCVLAIMWAMEEPRRSLGTWLGDMSKQLVGGVYAHWLNTGMAYIVGGYLVDRHSNNQCVWYTVAFMADVCCVTFLCWYVTAQLRPVILEAYGIEIGDYETTHHGEMDIGDVRPDDAIGGSNVSTKIWAQQLAIWLGIVSFVKAIVFFASYLCQDMLYSWFAWCYKILGLCGHLRAQLIVSVIILPIVGDAFQFAIQDGFLKKETKLNDRSVLQGGGTPHIKLSSRNLAESELSERSSPRGVDRGNFKRVPSTEAGRSDDWAEAAE